MKSIRKIIVCFLSVALSGCATAQISGGGQPAQAGTGLTQAGSTISANFGSTAGTIRQGNAVDTVAQGGTGLSSITAHYLTIGNGTGNLTLLAPGTSGYVLTSNGASADPSWQVAPSALVSSVFGQTGAIANISGDAATSGSSVLTLANTSGARADIGLGSSSNVTFAGITAGGAVNYAAPVTLASASSVAIGGAASNNIVISGTTTITSFDTVAAGITRRVTFTGTLTLTYNATSLILPGKLNITARPGDYMVAESLGSGNWVVTSYTSSNVGGYAKAPLSYAYVTGNQSLTSGVEASVHYNTVLFDPTGAWVVGAPYFNPAAAGYYSAHSTVYVTGTTITSCYLRLYKNAALYSEKYFQAPASQTSMALDISTVLFLDGNTDEVQSRILCAGTGLALDATGLATTNYMTANFVANN